MKSTIKGLLAVMAFSIISLSALAQPPASWSYFLTNSNHTILVTCATIDGVPAPTTNCYIGVFYNLSTGGTACGGNQAWTGSQNAVTAWGAETVDDGFQAGEAFQWKIYANGIEYSATATYMPVGFPDGGTYAANGLSGTICIDAFSALNIEVVEWLSPMTSCGLSSTETVTVSFRNDTLGNITEPFFVKYSIDGGSTWVTETYSGGVAPGDTTIYSFTQTADFSAFASNAGNNADTIYDVMFQIEYASDLDSTDNMMSYNVANMVPPFTQLTGLNSEYCLYSSFPVTLTGIPGGGTFIGQGVQGNAFLIGLNIGGVGPGNYNVIYSFYDAATGCDGTDTTNVTIFAPPVSTISGYSSLQSCQYDVINLIGNPAGGTFSGTPFVNPTTGVFNPLISGNFNITYTYTDNNGCTDPSNVYAFHTNPLPNVTVDNLSRSYCANESGVVLNGNPSGGTFFVDNIALTSNIFNPNTVSTSVHGIRYVYSDANSCTDTFNINVKVFALPNVSFVGLDPEYCRYDDAVSLTGSPNGGSWTGTSGTNWFDPSMNGVFSVVYSYTQAFQYYGDTALCENSDTHFTTVHSLPVVNLASGLTTLPNGDVETATPATITLNAGNGFQAYEWNTGQTTQNITTNYDWGYNVLGFGGYKVAVTDNHTCVGVDSIFIGATDVKLGEMISPLSNCTLSNNELVIFSFINNGTHTFVPTNKIKFKANINGVNTISALFVLSSNFAPGDTMQYTLPTQLTNIGILANPGTYTLNAELDYQHGLNLPDINQANDLYSVEIVNGGLPSVYLGDDFSTLSPDTVVLDAGDFTSYLWNTGANTQTINVDVNIMNDYCVTVTDQFGCTATDCINVLDVVELAESFNKINLFPNPNNGQFTLVVENKLNTDIRYDLVDARGNIVLSDTKYNVNFIQEEIQLPGLAKGLYFLRVNNGIDINVIKIAVE